MDKPSPYDQQALLKENPDHFALKRMTQAIGPALVRAGALVYLSPDAAQVDITKDDLRIRVKVNEGELPKRGTRPFVLMHIIPDPEIPRNDIPDTSKPFEPKDIAHAEMRLRELFNVPTVEKRGA